VSKNDLDDQNLLLVTVQLVAKKTGHENYLNTIQYNTSQIIFKNVIAIIASL
jgi:hypothetical protein